MSSAALDQFSADSTVLACAQPEPADCVAAIAPPMHGLMARAAR